jgi:hypothetical protein
MSIDDLMKLAEQYANAVAGYKAGLCSQGIVEANRIMLRNGIEASLSFSWSEGYKEGKDSMVEDLEEDYFTFKKRSAYE